MSRTMQWEYNKESKIEESNILFEIDGKKYIDHHTFRIFTIDEMKKCCEKVGLCVKEVYANYDINQKGTATAKNLQFIIMPMK